MIITFFGHRDFITTNKAEQTMLNLLKDFALKFKETNY